MTLSNHNVHIEDHEIKIKDSEDCWWGEFKCDADVTSGCDHGDNGITNWGSGPWSECDINVESCWAKFERLDKDGETVETKEMTGQEALDFIDESTVIEWATDEHMMGGGSDPRDDYDEDEARERYGRE